jgi:hypothetical protein
VYCKWLVAGRTLDGPHFHELLRSDIVFIRIGDLVEDIQLTTTRALGSLAKILKAEVSV